MSCRIAFTVAQRTHTACDYTNECSDARSDLGIIIPHTYFTYTRSVVVCRGVLCVLLHRQSHSARIALSR